MHLLSQVSNIEKYTEDLKGRLTLNFLTQDIKRLKRKLKSNDGSYKEILQTIEKKAKQISKIKTSLRGLKNNGKNRNSSSS